MICRFIITVVFGVLWWWVYTQAGAGLSYLVILGSVLAVCACCCKGSGEVQIYCNFERYIACLRRCWLVTAVLMLSLIFVGIIVVFVLTGALPVGPVWTHILIAAIGAPLCVRAICCAYE